MSEKLDLSKISVAQWKAMKEAFGSMSNFMNLGGFGAMAQFFSGAIERVGSQITNSIEDAMSPVTGIISDKINTVFGDLAIGLQELLTGLENVKIALPNTTVEFDLLKGAVDNVEVSLSPLGTAMNTSNWLIGIWTTAMDAATAAIQAQKDALDLAESDERRGYQRGKGTRINKIKQLEQGFIN